MDYDMFIAMEPVEVYVYYDGPVFYSAQHEGQWYLVVLTDRDTSEKWSDVWLCWPTSEVRLVGEGDPMRPDGDVAYFVHTWRGGGKVGTIDPATLTKDNLPESWWID